MISQYKIKRKLSSFISLLFLSSLFLLLQSLTISFYKINNLSHMPTMSNNMRKNIPPFSKLIENSSSIKPTMISSFIIKTNSIKLTLKASTNSLISPNNSSNNSIILLLPLPMPKNIFKLPILLMILLIGHKNIYLLPSKIWKDMMLVMYLQLFNYYSFGSIEKDNKMIHGLLFQLNKLLIVAQIAE